MASLAYRREATNQPSHWCTRLGCPRTIYAERLCIVHWKPPPVATCGHAALIITCGRCRRVVCQNCYGPWNALACGDCRDGA